ncbi:hypothetical protein M9H77_11575 [Catharanthus roseus]|uniref:Uncharacterized protein n=1 Tax=Catharanthus roseus TaxID=4058 RepID=A0ACC0BEZ7_CATRO|nr:hypothetical protein M9H77_11575 [Catharanthus roseus]
MVFWLRSRSEGSDHLVTHRRCLNVARSTQLLLGVLSISIRHCSCWRPLSAAVEFISLPPLESPLEPETNPVIPTPSSSTPIPSSIPETPDLVSEGYDEEAEHPEAQDQAIRDYQLARDRVRRVPKEHPRYGYFYIVSYAFAVASYVEEREPLCFPEPILSPYDELDLSWRRGTHLIGSRNIGSDWA